METVGIAHIRPGRLESVTSRVIEGWAASGHGESLEGCPTEPATMTSLDVVIDGELYGQIAATLSRPDIAHPGAVGFRLYLPDGLTPSDRHTVSVRLTVDGTELAGSPVEIPDAADRSILLRAIVDAIAALTDPALRDDAIRGLVASVLVARSGACSGLPDPPRPELPATGETLSASRWLSTKCDLARTPVSGLPRNIALVIDDRAPDTNRDAGSRAILSHMQSLTRLGYQVAFVPSRTLALETLDKDLFNSGITAFSLPWIASVEEVLRRIGDRLALVYVHRHTNLSLYAALIRDAAPAARLVCCLADLHFLRLERQAAMEGNDELTRRLPHLRATELASLAKADALVAHSPIETNLLAEHLQSSAVYTVPWHVDPLPVEVPLQLRRGIAFVGSFDHAPNRDAAEVLVSRIMPLVHARDPTLDCLLVGSAMPGTIASLARPGIIPLDAVTDMREIWSRVRLTVAPLRYGAGLKGKVLDSAAAGIPFVATPAAVEGMELPPALAAGITADPVRFAEAILALHWDQHANERAAAEGLAWIGQIYCRAAIDRALAPAVR